jgi:hypothetical protein
VWADRGNGTGEKERKMPKAIACWLALAASAAGLPAAAQHEPVWPNLLLREVVAGMPRGDRHEVRVLTVTFAPGQPTPCHTHRFPLTVYVLEGAFTSEMGDASREQRMQANPLSRRRACG